MSLNFSVTEWNTCTCHTGLVERWLLYVIGELMILCSYTLVRFALVWLAIMCIHGAHSWMCSPVCGEHIIDVRPEPIYACIILRILGYTFGENNTGII